MYTPLATRTVNLTIYKPVEMKASFICIVPHVIPVWYKWPLCKTRHTWEYWPLQDAWKLNEVFGPFQVYPKSILSNDNPKYNWVWNLSVLAYHTPLWMDFWHIRWRDGWDACYLTLVSWAIFLHILTCSSWVYSCDSNGLCLDPLYRPCWFFPEAILLFLPLFCHRSASGFFGLRTHWRGICIQ